MITKIPAWFAVAGLCLAGGPALAAPAAAPASSQATARESGDAAATAAAEGSGPADAKAMLMLDYQLIPVPAGPSIDLMGFHVLNQMNDWLYLGIGVHAPLVRGEYGGFMVLDAAAHVQRRIAGNLFANAGLALGGGGGGRSAQQSKELSGTGGFFKAYVGVGYDFGSFSAGANIARTKFTQSSIDHSQLNVFLQVPFSYAIGPYARSGEGYVPEDESGTRSGAADPGETMLSLGLDNFRQIDPVGSNKGTINLADLQYSHFLTSDAYWFFNAGVGYRGLPLYNEVLGGIGYRVRLSPAVNLYGQLGLGSGGYAPDTVDTGAGLLVYPRVSAEYMVSRNLGVSLSAGYLLAPKGSSKNYTFGAALNYHLRSGEGGSGERAAADGASYRGYRINLFQQTGFNVRYRNVDRSRIEMLSIQADNIIDDHVFVPVQVSVAYGDYLGYPGYGELLAGVGVQNRYGPGDRVQVFGQLLVGTNVHGGILKTGLGINVGLSDRLAAYGLAGQTFAGVGSNGGKFRSDYVGLGLSYRFSKPSR